MDCQGSEWAHLQPGGKRGPKISGHLAILAYQSGFNHTSRNAVNICLLLHHHVLEWMSQIRLCPARATCRARRTHVSDVVLRRPGVTRDSRAPTASNTSRSARMDFEDEIFGVEIAASQVWTDGVRKARDVVCQPSRLLEMAEMSRRGGARPWNTLKNQTV